MKVALYKDLKYNWGWIRVAEVTEDREASKEDVRISEIVEVEFPLLSKNDTVHRELDILEAVENDLRAKFDKALSDLNDRRSKLLALTHQAEA